MTGINKIMQPALQALPASAMPFDGLKIQITSEEIRSILSGRIERLQDEIDKAKTSIERTKKFAEQFGEQNDGGEAGDIRLTRLVSNNRGIIETGETTLKLLVFLRDHTPLNQIFIVSWDDFTSSLLDPRQ